MHGLLPETTKPSSSCVYTNEELMISEKADMFADVHDLFIQTSSKATAGARRLNKSTSKTKRRITQSQIVKKINPINSDFFLPTLK